MKRALIALALSPLLMAGMCGRKEPPTVEFPQLPDLPAEARRDCPPADPLITGTLGELVTADSRLAIEYAKCRERRRVAVGAYDAAQRLLREADAKANAAKAPNAPR